MKILLHKYDSDCDPELDSNSEGKKDMLRKILNALNSFLSKGSSLPVFSSWLMLLFYLFSKIVLDNRTALATFIHSNKNSARLFRLEPPKVARISETCST